MAGNRVVWTFVANDKFSRVARNIKKRTNELKKNFARMSLTAKKAGAAIKKLGNALKKMSIASTVAIGGSAKAFSDMEQGITNILTLLDDQKQIKQFGGTIEKLATGALTKFGFTTAEATGALFDLVSALGPSESTFESFAAAQKLAIGGNADLAVSSLGVARIMVAYENETLSATDVANGFFASQKKGITTVEKMARNIGKVSKTAAGAGIKFQELLATTAELTKSFSTEESITGFKALINSLIAPTDDARRVLEHFNVPVSIAQIETIGWTETLRRLAGVADKSKDALKTAIPSIEGYQAAAALTSKAVENIVANMKDMNKNQLDPAFALQIEVLARKTKIMKGKVSVLAQQIGHKLLPTILKLFEFINKLIDRYNAMSEANKTLVSKIILFSAVIAPLVLGLAAIIAVAGPVLLIFGKIILVLALARGVVNVLQNSFEFLYTSIAKGLTAIKRFFGFGDTEQFNINAAAEITNSSTAKVDVNFNDPKNTIKNIKTTTSGKTPNLAIGMNLVGES